MPILINNEKLTVLNSTRLPARLTVSQTAAVLGFEDHNIPVLVKARLLTPLGKPAPNATKYFAAVSVTGLAQDPAWLAKATNALYSHWLDENSRRPKTEETDLDVLVTTE
jgi:hypothetical protein